jgi:hypothetical protein
VRAPHSGYVTRAYSRRLLPAARSAGNRLEAADGAFFVVFIFLDFSQAAKNKFLNSSQAKTDFLHSKLFKSGQNRLPQYQAIPVSIILSITPLSSPCLDAAGHQTIQFLFKQHVFSENFLYHYHSCSYKIFLSLSNQALIV